MKDANVHIAFAYLLVSGQKVYSTLINIEFRSYRDFVILNVPVLRLYFAV